MAKTPRAMEDMLASIRQAIHQESAYQAAGLHAPEQAGEVDSPPPASPRPADPANDDRSMDLLRPLRPTNTEAEDWEAELAGEGPGTGDTGRRGADLTGTHTLKGQRRVFRGVLGGRMDIEAAMERLGEQPGAAGHHFDDPEFHLETEHDAPDEEAAAPDLPVEQPEETAADAGLPADGESEASGTRTALEPLLSPLAREAAASAFSRLDEAQRNWQAMPMNGQRMEQVVRELLEPMLRDWLDANLPDLVERLVREEIDRIAHGGKD